jgi:DNA-binding NtrC family response regulator
VYEQIGQVARTNATALIRGESGTGKELVAHAIHANSPRARAPFVKLNCAALPETLIESELFGHERGAFTGADDARAGLLAEAEGGVLFFDEIGELPLSLQPLLLGVLERRRSRRIGGASDQHHDVRIIAATNRNLAEEVRAKRFREDLYYRLAVARLRVPPLRERADDIPILANQFAREAGGALATDAIAALCAYTWPGNVRELRNTVTRLVVQRGGGELPELPVASAHGRARSLCDANGNLLALPDLRERVAEELEREYLEAVLQRAHGNLSRAAELAGVTRQYLTSLAVKHNLHPRR